MSDITVDNFEKEFRKLQLQDDVSNHLRAKENRKALKVLRELRPLQSDEDVVAKIYYMIMEGECHLYLEKYSSASAVIHEIEKLLKSPKVMPDDVNQMAKKFKDRKMYIRAYIAYYAACKLHMIKSANVAASKIKPAFDDMWIMVEEMEKSADVKNVLAKHMIPAMKKVVEELVAMPDNESPDKVNQQAWCYLRIGWSYYYLKDNEQELTMYGASIKLMREKLGDDAEKYLVTGLAYNNAGVAYSALGLKEKTISAYKDAIRVYVKATDIVDEKEREKEIVNTRNNLKNLKNS